MRLEIANTPRQRIFIAGLLLARLASYNVMKKLHATKDHVALANTKLQSVNNTFPFTQFNTNLQGC